MRLTTRRGRRGRRCHSCYHHSLRPATPEFQRSSPGYSAFPRIPCAGIPLWSSRSCSSRVLPLPCAAPHFVKTRVARAPAEPRPSARKQAPSHQSRAALSAGASANLAILPRSFITMRLGDLGADERKLLQEHSIATFDGSSDLVDRLDEALQSLHESDAGHGGERFEEFPVQRIEEAYKLSASSDRHPDPRQCSKSCKASADFAARFSGCGSQARDRSDPRWHEDFVAKRARAQQERVSPDAIIKNLTRDFGDQESSP